jgi:hypothetical protein
MTLRGTESPRLSFVHRVVCVFPTHAYAPLALALITGLLTVNPQDRMSLADAFRHPWVLTYVLVAL